MNRMVHVGFNIPKPSRIRFKVKINKHSRFNPYPSRYDALQFERKIPGLEGRRLFSLRRNRREGGGTGRIREASMQHLEKTSKKEVGFEEHGKGKRVTAGFGCVRVNGTQGLRGHGTAGTAGDFGPYLACAFGSSDERGESRSTTGRGFARGCNGARGKLRERDTGLGATKLFDIDLNDRGSTSPTGRRGATTQRGSRRVKVRRSRMAPAILAVLQSSLESSVKAENSST
ncbi:hypothetical protein DFH06DRAFT_1139987 [Mycena polygramma]|nr:hypothetical protein DFH06DRAFT_1139987 [Mycena polygramma]